MKPKIDQPRFFYNSIGLFIVVILLAFVSCDDGRVEELEAELEQCRYELEECQDELERCQEELEECEYNYIDYKAKYLTCERYREGCMELLNSKKTVYYY